VARRLLGVIALALGLVGCGAQRSSADDPPLRIRDLRASVVRMATLRDHPLYGNEPLLGVRLRADTCAPSLADARDILPTSYRVAHFVTRRPKAANWGRPFRVMTNDVYWIVPFGETGRVCRVLDFDDVVPPDNYQGVESALGHLRGRCYGVRLTIEGVFLGRRRDSPPISASRRAIVQCSRFGPR
jgi:hypothetical protein